MIDLNFGDTRLIIHEAKRRNVLRNQLAYLLATARWETANTMKPVREAFWNSEEWREFNLRYYPWYGRGFVQLTWKSNYEKAGNAIGVDLIGNPDGALEPYAAAKVLVAGCMEGWFTGKMLSDYIDIAHSDYWNARRVVNGTDKASEIAELAEMYDEALRAEGYGEATGYGGFLQWLVAFLRGFAK